MTTEIESAGGWLIKDTYMWWAIAGWVVVVLLYGLYRSLGTAEPDPIRTSGPLPEA